jgi:antitoxin ParD1/3/4
MATTSLSLGDHWEVFIKNEIASGRYGSASEVVRDALRNLEERKAKLNALRTHLSEGAAQAQRGDFVAQPIDEMLSEFKEEQRGKSV